MNLVGKTAVARGAGQIKYRITKVTKVNIYMMCKENRGRKKITGSVVIPRSKFSTLIESVV